MIKLFNILTIFSSFIIDIHRIENIESPKFSSIEEFTVLFRKYYEPLYFFAVRFVKDPSTAESIVQDVFVNLWDIRETISIKISIKAYLYTSVKNSCLNYIKRENFFFTTDENNEPLDISGKTPLDTMENDEITSAVRNAINKLPEKCREIFMMCRYDELSYKEIAEILEISVNTVKTQLKRAMKSLYENLGHLRSIIIFIQFMIWWYANK